MARPQPRVMMPPTSQSVEETLREVLEYERQCGPVKTYPARFRVRPVCGTHGRVGPEARLSASGLALTKAAWDLVGGIRPVYVEVDLIRKAVLLLPCETYDRREAFKPTGRGEIHAPAMVRELKHHGFGWGTYSVEYDAHEHALVLRPPGGNGELKRR